MLSGFVSALAQRGQFEVGAADELTDRRALVAAEVVHGDEIAAAQRRREHLLDIDSKALAVPNRGV